MKQAATMRTVLVVEDEPISRAMAELTFQQMGYAVIAAATGEDALALAMATRGLDLLFTDIDLGPGLSGWHVARQARVHHPMLLVVYTSGLAGQADHAEFGVEGSVLLAKPYETYELTAALQNTGQAG
jgi:CheY-like chemotaxis protein